ncbi:hypothetical protein [uncultured Oxalicibacterium sp.]|uniref:hypothetical protein n=1 Tax=uncultured Oxalicibacterium sp. TaxID=1168540 RepID=UPI0025E3AE7D|nr:hypothetical protein [uncultured Oxalicibacterium sp.]
MKINEEFTVKASNGKTLTLQNIVAGKTYLDYGYTTLPGNFTGYRVKDTNGTAEKLPDGSFKSSVDAAIYKRV